MRPRHAFAPVLIALAAAAPAGAAALSGHTAQGLPVALGAAHAGHRDFRYQARMACSDGSTFTDDAFTDSVRVVRGRFARRVTSDRGAVHTAVTGVIAGRRAHGTIRILERYSEVPDAHGDTPLTADGGILCDSRVVRWSATAR